MLFKKIWGKLRSNTTDIKKKEFIEKGYYLETMEGSVSSSEIYKKLMTWNRSCNTKLTKEFDALFDFFVKEGKEVRVNGENIRLNFNFKEEGNSYFKNTDELNEIEAILRDRRQINLYEVEAIYQKAIDREKGARELMHVINHYLEALELMPGRSRANADIQMLSLQYSKVLAKRRRYKQAVYTIKKILEMMRYKSFLYATWRLYLSTRERYYNKNNSNYAISKEVLEESSYLAYLTDRIQKL